MRFGDHVFDLRRRSRTLFGECPYCHGHRLKKYGKEHGHQRWACRDCGKTFSDRTRTILCSSKLKPSQMRKLVSMLSDGTTLRQAANQAHVSLQTALLWKRKTQKMSENAGNTVLSGMVWVDHAYINAPMSVRKGKKRRGLSRHLLQVAAGIDSRGHVLLRLGSWGLAGTGDSRDAFLGHIAPGSVVYHDIGALRRLLSRMQRDGGELEGQGSLRASQSGQPPVRTGQAEVCRAPADPPQERSLVAGREGVPEGKDGEHGIREIPVVLL